MKLRHQHIHGFARAIARALHDLADVQCQEPLPRIEGCVVGAIEANLAVERTLEDEADQLLQQQLRAHRGGGDIDHEKARQLIKKELAKKKGFIL